jgi:hypothetical protein
VQNIFVLNRYIDIFFVCPIYDFFIGANARSVYVFLFLTIIGGKSRVVFDSFVVHKLFDGGALIPAVIIDLVCSKMYVGVIEGTIDVVQYFTHYIPS